MNDPQIRLRIADPQDAEILADLGARTFSQTFENDNTPEDMAEYLSSSFSLQKQAEELAAPGSVFVIAESEGKAVGFARLLGGSTETCITGSRPVELVRIYVEKDWLGKRVGRLLLERCLQEARGRGYGTIWLGVWEKNARAIAFYQKCGFTKCGTHVFRLGQDEQQDWIMQQSLG